MKPLVERLRTWVGNPLCIEAAENLEAKDREIRRLRYLLARVSAVAQGFSDIQLRNDIHEALNPRCDT